MLAMQAATMPENHLAEVLALNNANTPHVNALTGQELQALIDQAIGYQVLISEEGRLAGFVLLIGEGQSYQSLNYRWFSENMNDFLYVDRIVVAPEFRGEGVADQLYLWAKTTAQGHGVSWLACEVNLKPPNQRSLAFHHKQGFREIAQQQTEGGQKTVALMKAQSNV